jgi:leucyl/phenylalanyl-tRNA--protein transferase
LFQFPDPNLALTEPNGLLATGGDLSPDMLLSAYQQGIFPWFGPGEPIMWWSPDPRMVLFFSDFKLSTSTKKNLKKYIKQGYSISCDQDFDQVIHQCAHIPSRQNKTWITDEMLQAYTHLHQLGFAHSIEVWSGKANNSELVGGVYGVSLGQTFFGESMFSTQTDTSKIALYYLIQFLSKQGLTWLDCQVPSEHLMRLGAKAISRAEFLSLLKESLALSSSNNINWPATMSL